MIHRLKLCSSGKWTFATAQDAWRRLCEVKRLNRKQGNTYHPIRVYECPECGFWHLTSTPNRHH